MASRSVAKTGQTPAVVCRTLALQGQWEELAALVAKTKAKCWEEILQQAIDVRTGYQTDPEKIRRGIWPSLVHRKACEELGQTSMIAWLDIDRKSELGYLSKRFFDLVSSPEYGLAVHFVAKKEVVPSDALEAAITGLTLCDHTVMLQLALYKSLLHILGKPKFDRLFGQAVGVQIMLGSNDKFQGMRHFVDLSSDQNFKIRLICDLIRVPLERVSINFVRAHVRTEIDDPVLIWAEEVQAGEALPLSQFNSALDGFLLPSLGQDLFQSNVGKVYVMGRPFVLIADRNREQRLRALLPELIQRVAQSQGKIALFVESCERDPSAEKVFFRGWLQGKSVSGKLCGMEESHAYMISDFLSTIHFLYLGCITDRHPIDLLYNLMNAPSYIRLWESFKKEEHGSLHPMVMEIDQAIQISQTKTLDRGKVHLSHTSFFRDSDKWMALYRALIRTLLNNSPLIREEKELIEWALDSQVGSAMVEAAQAMLRKKRDTHSAKSIRDLAKEWPKETEIVVFTGFLHMLDILKNLQELDRV